MTDLGRIFSDITKCHLCRERISEIDALGEIDFIFHWLPYWRGNAPLRYVLLGWEPPSFKYHRLWAGETYEEGNFSFPLQFFIGEYLTAGDAEVGVLITNMAQCSMETGSLCNRTRESRFTTCYQHLERMILEATRGDARWSAISIGQAPIRFLERHQQLREKVFGDRVIFQLTHYSPRCNRYFRKFALDHKVDFDKFSSDVSTRYEKFLGGRNSSSSETTRQSEVERIFKWRYEFHGADDRSRLA